MIDIEEKYCKGCDQIKSVADYYSQKVTLKNGEIGIKYITYCKACWKERAKEYQAKNKEKHNQHQKKYLYNTEKGKITKIRSRNKWIKNGGQKNWQRNNRDKLNEYRENREQNKKHEISSKEWQDCKSYFNNECAYCGLHISDHFNTYKNELKHTDFHKEHVSHEGLNDLSNCVPSCKSCNSQKWKYEFEDWYNQDNAVYAIHRYEKIVKWLTEDYKKYIK